MFDNKYIDALFGVGMFIFMSGAGVLFFCIGLAFLKRMALI